MTKTEFLSVLKKGLGGLPHEEADERVNFYSEMIDDLVEEGLTEEEAVERIGSVGDIVTQILTDDTVPQKKKKEKRRLGALEITLLALGSPIWLALLVSAFAVVISIYAVLWSLVVSFWSVFASLAGCAVGGVVMLITECIKGNTAGGVAMLGMGIFLAGLAIFVFYGCAAATKASAQLTKKSYLFIVSLFTKKEEEK